MSECMKLEGVGAWEHQVPSGRRVGDESVRCVLYYSTVVLVVRSRVEL